jgi:serine/threonine-protein kinase RsbW
MHNSDQDRTEFLHVTLPARLNQLPVLRQQVRRCVAGLAIPPDRQAETILAVDEAATNAVLHAYAKDHPGPIDLTIWTDPNDLWIQIFDRGRWREPGSAAGLGLTLMHRLVDCVLIEHGPRGTTVMLRRQITPSTLDTTRHRPTRHRRGR